MIYDHFRATGAHDAAHDLSDLFNIYLHEDDIQDFDTRCDQALLTASEIPTENVLEGLCKLKIRGFVQLQTVLAVYDQDIDRNLVMPSYQRVKTVRRRHIDQMDAQLQSPDRIETGVLVESHKGKVSVGRTVFERRLL